MGGAEAPECWSSSRGVPVGPLLDAGHGPPWGASDPSREAPCHRQRTQEPGGSSGRGPAVRNSYTVIQSPVRTCFARERALNLRTVGRSTDEVWAGSPHCWFRAGVPEDLHTRAGFLRDSRAGRERPVLQARAPCPSHAPGHAPGQGLVSCSHPKPGSFLSSCPHGIQAVRTITKPPGAVVQG